MVEIEATTNRAGIETKIAADIDVALWLKSLFIASFSGVGAIANAPAGVLRSDPALRGQMIGAMKDAVIPGVKVTLTSGSGQTKSALTDATGRFQFTGLQPGAYTVSVTFGGATASRELFMPNPP